MAGGGGSTASPSSRAEPADPSDPPESDLADPPQSKNEIFAFGLPLVPCRFNPSSRIGPSGANTLSISRSDPPPAPPPNIIGPAHVLADL